MGALAALILVAYFLPTIIAWYRRGVKGRISTDRFCGTVLVNLLLGWTVVGWIIAFAMAASDPRAPRYVYVYEPAVTRRGKATKQRARYSAWSRD